MQIRGNAPLSTWVSAVSRIDARPAVVCDDRKVSISANVSQFEDLAAAVRAAGVTVTGPEPAWRFACDAPTPANELPQGVMEPRVHETPPEPSIASQIARGGLRKAANRVDWLADHGFTYHGCANGSVLLRGPNGEGVTLTTRDLARSNMGLVWKCRVG